MSELQDIAKGAGVGTWGLDNMMVNAKEEVVERILVAGADGEVSGEPSSPA